MGFFYLKKSKLKGKKPRKWKVFSSIYPTAWNSTASDGPVRCAESRYQLLKRAKNL